MSEILQLNKEFVIEDLETLKVIADPLRLRILKSLKEPSTVKRIASELDRPPTKLYYHVNQLEKHGLIRIVETNVVSGIIEKQYQVTAKRYRVDEALLSDRERFTEESLETLVTAIIEDTKEELMQSIRSGQFELHDDTRGTGQVLRSGFRLRPEQVSELSEELTSLTETYDALSLANEEDDSAHRFGFTTILYPLQEASRSPDSNE